jgi:hypothetical protein
MMPKLISMVKFIMNSNEKGKYCQQLIMLLPSIIGMGALIGTTRECNRPTCDCLQYCESKLDTTDSLQPRKVSFALWRWCSTV